MQVAGLGPGEAGLGQQLAHAQNGIHRRANFVAHVGQKVLLGLSTDFGLALGLAQAGLEQLLRRHIEANADGAHMLAVVVVERGPAHQQPPQVPIFGGYGNFVGIGHALLPNFHLGFYQLEVVAGEQQRREALPGQLFAAKAGHVAEALVGVEHVVVQVDFNQAERHVFDDATVLFFALAQVGLGLGAGRNIGVLPKMTEVAILVEYGHEVPLQNAPVTQAYYVTSHGQAALQQRIDARHVLVGVFDKLPGVLG